MCFDHHNRWPIGDPEPHVAPAPPPLPYHLLPKTPPSSSSSAAAAAAAASSRYHYRRRHRDHDIDCLWFLVVLLWCAWTLLYLSIYHGNSNAPHAIVIDKVVMIHNRIHEHVSRFYYSVVFPFVLESYHELDCHQETIQCKIQCKLRCVIDTGYYAVYHHSITSRTKKQPTACS